MNLRDAEIALAAATDKLHAIQMQLAETANPSRRRILDSQRIKADRMHAAAVRTCERVKAQVRNQFKGAAE